MSITDIKWNDIVTMVAMVIALCAAYTGVMNARKTHADAVAQKNQPLAEVRQMLANDKARLDNHEVSIKQLSERTSEQDKEMKLMLKAQLALLRHGIDGNNIQGLRDNQQSIQEYLVDR